MKWRGSREGGVAGIKFHLAWRRRGAFCKGVVSTARRGGLPFAPAKGSKTGQRGTGLSPLQTPLTLSCAGYGFRFFSVEKSKSALRTDALQRTPAAASAPSALRCPKKSSRCSLARFFRPLRVLRLAASATGGARLRTPYPSPDAGRGASGQVTACFTHSLGSVTFCDWLAETKLK